MRILLLILFAILESSLVCHFTDSFSLQLGSILIGLSIISYGVLYGFHIFIDDGNSSNRSMDD